MGTRERRQSIYYQPTLFLNLSDSNRPWLCPPVCGVVGSMLLGPAVLNINVDVWVLFFCFALVFFPTQVLLPRVLFDFLDFFAIIPLQTTVSRDMSPLLVIALLLLTFLLLPFLPQRLHRSLLQLLHRSSALLHRQLLQRQLWLNSSSLASAASHFDEDSSTQWLGVRSLLSVGTPVDSSNEHANVNL